MTRQSTTQRRRLGNRETNARRLDPSDVLICYWCRTPITSLYTEWRGEPVHTGCPA